MRAIHHSMLAVLLLVVLFAAASLEAQRIQDGLVVLYDFVEGDDETVVEDRTPDPLDLVINESDVEDGYAEWLPDRGLALNIGTGPQGAGGASPIQSTEPAMKIFEAIAAPDGTSEYTLEAWVRPEVPNLQSNISRIATYSFDPYARNFTLGTVQTGDQYVNRLRTLTTGVNGLNGPGQLITAGAPAVRAGELQHVVFTRTVEAEESIWVDNELLANRVVNPSDDLSDWDPTYYFALGNEFVEAGRKFNGEYYLIAIYDFALSAEEVDQNFKAGLGGGPEGPLFVRSDANADGSVNLSDGSFILNFLFVGGSPAPTCEDAADANSDGKIDLTDGVFVLTYLFSGGADPGPPYPDCGTVELVLGCESFEACP